MAKGLIPCTLAWWLIAGLELAAAAGESATPAAATTAASRRPNLLLAIADDWSFGHAGAYGCTWVETPAFDRVAREGVLFNRAYTPNAKCAPSRACLLTGRNSWQLGAAANHVPFFPPQFKSFPEALAEHGVFTGFTAKGWGPGVAANASGQPRFLTGRPFNARTAAPPASGIGRTDYAANFADFLDAAPADRPWCFWYGAIEPHRGYEYGSGVAQGGKRTDAIARVPGCWPDNEVVRNDLLDYAFEVEHFDRHLGRMLAELERRGQLDHTLVVVTSDHGMPFPRAKGQAYEASNHVPLAIRWPAGIPRPGRVVEDYVSFVDLAPTFLEVAGLSWADSRLATSPGRSLVELLRSGKSGQVDPARDRVLIGKERHDVGRPQDQGYPIRGLVKAGWLYLHNFEPGRWPAGNPETGYLNCDGGPTKTEVLKARTTPATRRFWELSFGPRPTEEFYDLAQDPDCVLNLAGDPAHAARLAQWRRELLDALRAEGDPRMEGQGEQFDRFPYADAATRDFHARFTRGESVKAGWVNASDFDPAAAEPDWPALFREATANGRQAGEALSRCQRYVQAWLAKADPATGLIPRNLTPEGVFWNGRDAGADNYPYMVLTAWFTDRALMDGRLRDILTTEQRLTARVDRLPDDYAFAKAGWRRESFDLDATIFDGAEYVKDGLIPLTEWLGPSPWSERMIGIVEDIWKHARIATPFGTIPTLNFEVNGDLLQAGARLFWLTGETKHLDWAARLGDFYLLGTNHPTRDLKQLRLRDHGCEVVNGLTELYVAMKHTRPDKAAAYREPLHALFDRILEVGRNEHGLLYDWFNPQTGEHSAGVCDTWGYVFDGFYTVHLLDGVPAYREAALKAMGSLLPYYSGHRWEGESADGYADSIEGAINLLNREPVAAAASWVDREIQVMWAKQKSDGIIEGWHGDGNFARTSLMYALWKTQGASAHPWRADVRLGAARDGDRGVCVSLAADGDWSGRVVFDRPRHRESLHLPLDYPRINQFPEWFPVEAGAQYEVLDVARDQRWQVTGRELREGLSLQLPAGEERRLRVRPLPGDANIPASSGVERTGP